MAPPGAAAQGAGRVDKLLPAIAKNEGTGAYTQLGPVTKTGDRAYGKYQVMGANISQWTQQILGANDASAVFQSPDAQEKVARAKLSEYAAKYGPEGATKAWFAGPTGMNNLMPRTCLARLFKLCPKGHGQYGQYAQIGVRRPRFAYGGYGA